MASRGLKKRPVLEDLIGEGISVRAPQRPYTQLADDPRVLAYSNLGQDPATWRDLEWKLHAARRFQDEVRWAAMSCGGEVAAHMAASGLGRAPAPGGTIVGDHDSKIEESIAADEAARRAAIDNHLSRIENHKRMAAEELNHIRSKSAVEQARSIGYGVGSTAAGLVGAPGVIADLAGWFAANGAQDAVELTEQLAQLARDLSSKAEKHRVETSITPSGFMRDRFEACFSALLSKA